MLFVGTQSNLLAYDVERNADVFFRDVQDGVNTISIGRLGNAALPIVVSGGNCSILGYNKDGMEVFWTVTGDNVSSVALSDVDGDGANELVVGSDDFEIRVYKNERLLAEITEADKVTLLSSLPQKKFSYGLSNGTVGVYESSSRRSWRVKTKNKVSSLEGYDIDSDGVLEVVSGWSNGVVSARNDLNGEVIFKDSLGSPISALCKSDYRMDGKEELIVCSESGLVRGYIPTCEQPAEQIEMNTDIRAIGELQARKQEMMTELRQLEKNLKTLKVGENIPGALPGSTKLTVTLEPDQDAGHVSLTVTVSTEAQLVNLVAIDLGTYCQTSLLLRKYSNFRMICQVCMNV